MAKVKTIITRSPRDVTASYDAATDTVQNKYRWAYTDSLTANDANSLDVRRKIWERARYCADNNSYCFGILDSKAQDAIGTGPRLQFNTNDIIHTAFEKDWKAWIKEVKLAEGLRSMIFGKDKDGEQYLMKVTNKKLKSKVKLDFKLYEPEQIASNRWQKSKTEVDGVKVDEHGNATHYHLLNSSPANVYSGSISVKGKWIPVDQMLQYANINRPGQLRGISSLTPVLELFEMLRSYTTATLAAAETAANHAGLLYTESPGESAPPDNVELEYEVDIGMNTLKALPYGWKMSQLKPEQPTTTYSEFKNEILREVARCIHSPWNVSSGDSSSYNYSSGQLDRIRYDKSLEIERDNISAILESLFADFANEWMLKNGVKGIDLSHYWMYDPLKHADPVKEATAQKLRMENGTSNLEIECAKDGRDWKVVVDKAAEIAAYTEVAMAKAREKVGLPPLVEEKDPNEQKTDNKSK